MLDLGIVTPNQSEFLPFPVLPDTGKGNIFILQFFYSEPNAEKEHIMLRAKIFIGMNPTTGGIIFPVSQEPLIFEFDIIHKIAALPYSIEALKRRTSFNTNWTANLLQL